MNHRNLPFATSETCTDYASNGYALLDFRATDKEICEVEEYIAKRVSEEHAGNIYDRHGQLRALHGYEKRSGMLSGLMARLADISRRLLECEHVYVYQFRVNVKNGNKGKSSTSGSWKPHRDFDYWQRMDGMREPHAVVFHMLVNDHHTENGPLEICPGTHKLELDEKELIVASESGWKAGFTENIKYQIDTEAFARKHIVPIHGGAGMLLAMHPKLWHASGPNMTDSPRVLLSIVFNDLSNAVLNPDRPSFIVQEPFLGTW